jgi:hypothetical protein
MLPDPGLREAAQAAAALLGAPPEGIARVHGLGRNSGIFRVSHGGAAFALKQYPPRRDGERNRATVESAALAFMTGHGIAVVPRVIAADADQGYALLEWIDGAAIAAPGAPDIDAACDFLEAIARVGDRAEAAALPPAAEACLSGEEILAQIDTRLRRLAPAAAAEPALARFLAEPVAPLLGEVAAWAQAGYAAHGLAFGQPIPPPARALCPADFGFHNALRRPAGDIVFIDFDYFGWDDPVKLVSDFLLHPGMQLPEPLKHRFAARARAIYGADPAYPLRLGFLFPLFALRWGLILLNEFLPERWALRVNAGGAADWTRVKQHQLARAERLVQSLTNNFRSFPYV